MKKINSSKVLIKYGWDTYPQPTSKQSKTWKYFSECFSENNPVYYLLKAPASVKASSSPAQDIDEPQALALLDHVQTSREPR